LPERWGYVERRARLGDPVTAAGPETRGISWLGSIGSRLNAWQRAAVFAAAVAVAGAGALAFGMWGRTQSQVSPARLDPGVVTAWGLPIVRLVVVVSAVGTIGMLVTGMLLPRTNREMSGEARRCLVSAGRLALVWAAATAAMLVLGWSDFTRLPVTKATVQQIFDGTPSYPDAMPFLFAAALAMVIAGAAYLARSATGLAVVLLLAVYNVLPLTTRGHEVEGAVIGIAVTVHVVALAVWMGGLAGLLIHVRRAPTLLAVAVPRFSRLALACFVAVAASGLAAAWVSLGSPAELRSTHYGTLVIYKAEALVVLGFLSWWLHRRTVPGVAQQRSRHAFTRFAALEIVVMAAAIALGVALAQTPAPAAPKPKPVAPSPYGAAPDTRDHALY